MKILFLDVDGVININGTFSKAAIVNLNKLLKAEKDLDIVISSSWRHKGLETCRDILETHGVDPDRIIGVTDSKPNDYERGHHIQRWLDKHKDIDKFVIFDDNSDIKPDMAELVQTNPHVGITSSDVKKALKILC
jgi:hypothetical protein